MNLNSHQSFPEQTFRKMTHLPKSTISSILSAYCPGIWIMNIYLFPHQSYTQLLANTNRGNAWKSCSVMRSIVFSSFTLCPNVNDGPNKNTLRFGIQNIFFGFVAPVPSTDSPSSVEYTFIQFRRKWLMSNERWPSVQIENEDLNEMPESNESCFAFSLLTYYFWLPVDGCRW